MSIDSFLSVSVVLMKCLYYYTSWDVLFFYCDGESEHRNPLPPRKIKGDGKINHRKKKQFERPRRPWKSPDTSELSGTTGTCRLERRAADLIAGRARLAPTRPITEKLCRTAESAPSFCQQRSAYVTLGKVSLDWVEFASIKLVQR